MPTTITSGASTISPQQVLGYDAVREGGTIVHPILGSANPDVTLRPAMLRSGTLELGFQGTGSEAASKTAADVLSTAATFTLSSTDRTTVNMTFVVNGLIPRALEDQSRDAWIVSVDFQEITA